MERDITIKTPDGFTIYGILREPKTPAKGLVIFVHGLTGNKNEHCFYNGARYFEEKGYATYRFDLYGGEAGSRTLRESTLVTHAEDINTVIRHFKSEFSFIITVGHSLGGLSVLLSDTSLMQGIVLWDPSNNRDSFKEDDHFVYQPALDMYLVQWGVEYVIGKKMYEHYCSLPDAATIMNAVHVPIKIIAAGKGVLMESSKEYFDRAVEPKELVVIENAGHCFDEHEVEKQLLDETYAWIGKCNINV